MPELQALLAPRSVGDDSEPMDYFENRINEVYGPSPAKRSRFSMDNSAALSSDLLDPGSQMQDVDPEKSSVLMNLDDGAMRIDRQEALLPAVPPRELPSVSVCPAATVLADPVDDGPMDVTNDDDHGPENEVARQITQDDEDLE